MRFTWIIQNKDIKKIENTLNMQADSMCIHLEVPTFFHLMAGDNNFRLKVGISGLAF